MIFFFQKFDQLHTDSIHFFLLQERSSCFYSLSDKLNNSLFHYYYYIILLCFFYILLFSLYCYRIWIFSHKLPLILCFHSFFEFSSSINYLLLLLSLFWYKWFLYGSWQNLSCFPLEKSFSNLQKEHLHYFLVVFNAKIILVDSSQRNYLLAHHVVWRKIIFRKN